MLGDVRTIQVNESAIAWLDVRIATKRQHAAKDEAERRRARVAPGRDIQRLTRQGLEAGSLGERQAINMDNLGCRGQISYKKLLTEHLKAKGYLK